MEPISSLFIGAGAAWLGTLVLWLGTPILVAGLVAALFSRRRLSEGQRIIVATVGGANLLQAGALLVAGWSWPMALAGLAVGAACVMAPQVPQVG